MRLHKKCCCPLVLCAVMIVVSGCQNNITNISTNDEAVIATTNETIEKSITATNAKTKILIENLEKIEEQFTKFASEKSSEMDYLSKASTQAITKVAGYANKLSQETKQNLEDLKNYYSDLEKLETTNTIKSTQQSTDKFLNETGFIIFYKEMHQYVGCDERATIPSDVTKISAYAFIIVSGVLKS